MTFKRLHLLNGAFSYQILHENTYSKIIYGLSVYPITFDLGWHWKVKSRSLGINLTVYHRQLDIISVADNWTAELSGREASCWFVRPFSQKLTCIIFYFGMNLPKDGTKPLDKDGFDWIALNVIFKGQKGINLSLCSHFDTYCLFILSLCAKF